METTTESSDNKSLENPALAPFSKMVLVGVPIAAILQKMKIQGFDDHVIQSFATFHKNQ